mmetsp:Transcript_5230/g.13336  ORF Transcript_5230/g.13336 Transcript_5230/m.13336 type:complete len:169 (-) Transcript_5230:524-1030(-)
MPGYQSVINHITGADGLLKKHVHLYKEGMEQDEPAAAGSEQTKDESANGEFENALIEVAELYEEAKAIEAGKSAAKKEAAGESKQAQRMQDEAVKKKYGEMSEEEYKVCMHYNSNRIVSLVSTFNPFAQHSSPPPPLHAENSARAQAALPIEVWRQAHDSRRLLQRAR